MLRSSLLALGLAAFLCHSRLRAADPLDFVPPSAQVVVVADDPRKLAEAVTTLDAFKEGRKLAPVRQLYDFKHGFRAGAFAVQMKDVVAKLDDEDMIAIAAYLATQAP